MNRRGRAFQCTETALAFFFCSLHLYGKHLTNIGKRLEMTCTNSNGDRKKIFEMTTRDTA